MARRSMPQPLDYQTPRIPPTPSWRQRFPTWVMLIILFIPGVLFVHGGRTIPGEKWSWDEIVLPPVGFPIVFILAASCYPVSSPLRRAKLLVVAAIAVAFSIVWVITSLNHR